MKHGHGTNDDTSTTFKNKRTRIDTIAQHQGLYGPQAFNVGFQIIVLQTQFHPIDQNSNSTTVSQQRTTDAINSELRNCTVPFSKYQGWLHFSCASHASHQCWECFACTYVHLHLIVSSTVCFGQIPQRSSTIQHDIDGSWIGAHRIGHGLRRTRQYHVITVGGQFVGQESNGFASPCHAIWVGVMGVHGTNKGIKTRPRLF